METFHFEKIRQKRLFTQVGGSIRFLFLLYMGASCSCIEKNSDIIPEKTSSDLSEQRSCGIVEWGVSYKEY